MAAGSDRAEKARHDARADGMDGEGAVYRVVPRWVWRAFCLVWLFFLIFPITGLAQAHAGMGRVVAAMAGSAVFVAIYLWLMLRRPFAGVAPAHREEVWPRLGLVGLLMAVVLGLTFADNSYWLWFGIYAGLAAGVALPPRVAAWATVGLVAVVAVVGPLVVDLPNTGRFALLVAVGGFGMIGVGRLIATVGELRAAREEIARLAVSEERLRFARDLHDLLGHSLSLIALKTELAGRLLPGRPERAAEEIRDAERAAREALREVREAVAGYRQPILDGELAGAREMLEAAGVAWRIEREAGPLPAAVDATLAWVVREGVTNAIRHGHAGRCEIRIGREAGWACASVTDDGRGNAADGRGDGGLDVKIGGSGLAGLAERVAARGGRFEAGPVEGGGFRLRVALPVGGKGAEIKGAEIENPRYGVQ